MQNVHAINHVAVPLNNSNDQPALWFSGKPETWIFEYIFDEVRRDLLKRLWVFKYRLLG